MNPFKAVDTAVKYVAREVGNRMRPGLGDTIENCMGSFYAAAGAFALGVAIRSVLPEEKYTDDKLQFTFVGERNTHDGKELTGDSRRIYVVKKYWGNPKGTTTDTEVMILKPAEGYRTLVDAVRMRNDGSDKTLEEVANGLCDPDSNLFVLTKAITGEQAEKHVDQYNRALANAEILFDEQREGDSALSDPLPTVAEKEKTDKDTNRLKAQTDAAAESLRRRKLIEEFLE